MSTRQPLAEGSVLLMLAMRLPEFESPPPPSTVVPFGQGSLPVACDCGGMSSSALWPITYLRGALAQTASTVKATEAPLRLLTSPYQPLLDGNELAPLTSRLALERPTPPPHTTVRGGQATGGASAAKDRARASRTSRG